MNDRTPGLSSTSTPSATAPSAAEPPAVCPETAPTSTALLLKQGRLARLLWLSLGLLLVGIGFVGLFLPLLPTVDFLILALPCFARSSPRLEAWLLDHPRFGPALRAWRKDRAIPRHAKMLACAGMALGLGLFWHIARPRLAIMLPVAALLAAAAGWIIARPTAASPSGETGPKDEPSGTA